MRAREHEKALDLLIRQSGIGGRLVLPSEICGGTLTRSESFARSRRLLLAMLWLASEEMRQGNRVLSRALFVDLRMIAGLAAMKDLRIIREDLERLAGDTILPAGGEAPAPVLESLRLWRDGETEKVDFAFSDPVRSWFMDPPRYGMIEMRVAAQMQWGIDLALYQRACQVVRMERPFTGMGIAEIRHALGASPDTPWARIAPRLAGAVGRVEKASRIRIEWRPVKLRGQRRTGLVEFTVGRDDRGGGHQARSGE